jgi:hypothetical protein
MNRRLALLLLASACSKSTTDTPAPAQQSSALEAAKPAPPAPAARPQVKDATVQDMLAKGSACKLGENGTLPLDCPEYKAIHDYAFQHQGSEEAAETCAASLADPDQVKRLLAAECLNGFNAVTETKVFAWGLDAVEAETIPEVQKEIAWGIMNAEAVTAKQDDRVIADIKKLSANPQTVSAASNLLDSLFPSYVIGSGPKPPPAAQQLALDALRLDDSPMQYTALNVALTHLDDKAAVCAALDAAITPTAKTWWMAAEGIVTMKDACLALLPKIIDVALARAATNNPRLEVLQDFDHAFELEPPTRAAIAKALREARAKVPSEYRDDLEKLAKQFSAPRVKKT